MRKASHFILTLTVLIATAIPACLVNLVWANDSAIWAGYKAKLVCSGVFVSKRSAEDVMKYDTAGLDYATQVDMAQSKVEARWNEGSVVAVYRGPELGCTLLPQEQVASHPSHPTEPREPAPSTEASQKKLWPEGDAEVSRLLTAETQTQIDSFLDHEFSEENPEQPKRNTRAIVIVHKGRIIAERYSKELGLTKDTPLIGWSMTKSITSALTGILVEKGQLALHQPLLFPEWAGDERSRITLDDLLRMASGIDFLEADTTEMASDVTRMLFLHPNTARYALGLKPAHPAGTVFNYSTGDSILISQAIRQSFGGDERAYAEFPRKALFDKLGMKSAVFEQDATGLYLGGTNVFATPRDWARFGLLYLNEGVWGGERILSKDWIAYTRQVAPSASERSEYYGAHFWLVNPSKARELGIPTDTYLAAGFKGQATFIIPSKDLVVVRMGWTDDQDYEPYDILRRVTGISISYRDGSDATVLK